MPVTQVFQFAVTIPAGTPIAAPLATPTTFEPNIVERIEWLFPHGCNGLVGVQFGARSVPVVPRGGLTFFTSSGTTHALAVEDMHVTGDWSVIGYNLGANPHTVQVLYRVRRQTPKADAFRLLDDADLAQFPLYEPVRHD